MRFWWPRQNHQIVTSTPRKQKPYLAPQPNPQYQHNYGAGYSINYVPPEWHSYRLKHILQLIPLPRRQQMLTCTCGHTSQGSDKHTQAMFARMWELHVASEEGLKTLFDTLHAALPEPTVYEKPDNPYFR